MVGVDVGNGPHLSVFVLLFRLVVLLGHVVNAVVVISLAIGIHHWGLISLTGATFLLHVPFLLAIAAQNVWVPGSIGATLGSSEGPFRLIPVVLSSNCSHMFKRMDIVCGLTLILICSCLICVRNSFLQLQVRKKCNAKSISQYINL